MLSPSRLCSSYAPHIHHLRLVSTSVNMYEIRSQFSHTSILLAGDVERNPGPRLPRYPCGECKMACSDYKGAKASILCESCDVWFHSECVGISDPVFSALGRSDTPWECCNCGQPNLSSGLFDSDIFDDSLDTSSSSSQSRSSCSSPLAMSSPKPSKTNRHTFQNLRLLEVNFQSLYSKREEFCSLTEAVKPDVIYGCETWLKANMSVGEVFPPGYDVYRHDRDDGYGGVILGIHNSLNNHQIEIKTNIDFVAAKIINGKQTIIVASFYRPTNNDQAYMDELCHVITNLCQRNPGAAIWIAGDINLPDIHWPTMSITSHQYTIAINEAFLQVLESTGLTQMIDFPTRRDNTLDIIATNRPSLVIKSHGLPGLSDHDIVFMEVNVRALRRKPVKRKILLWNKADLDSIRVRIGKWSNDFQAKYTASTNVEELAQAIQCELESVIEECVPSKLSSSRYNQPWFNSSTKRATRRKARAYRKARRTNRERDWLRFRRLKKESQRQCRSSYNKYIYDIVHSDPGVRNKKLGALIKSKRTDQMGVAP